MALKFIPEKKQDNFIHQLSGMENNMVDPALGLRMALSGFNPSQTGKELFHLGGKAAMFSGNPEISTGMKFIDPLLNAAGRIATGTTAGSAYEYGSPENKSSMKDVMAGNLGSNTLAEALTSTVRIPGGIAELINRGNYGKKISNKIHELYKSTKDEMNRMYTPVNEKYGSEILTQDPTSYLSNLGIERDRLFPYAQKKYDEFLDEATYKNLQGLKSNLGRDWAKTSKTPVLEKEAQYFNQSRDNIDQAVLDMLKNDPESLQQYMDATSFAKNNFYPYQSTVSLRRVGEKGISDVDPRTLRASIRRSTEKTAGSGHEERYLVPPDHPLRDILKEMSGKLNRSQIYQYLIPAIASGAISGVMSPGILPAALGAGSGAAIGHFASPIGAKVLQNPSIENFFRKLSAAYYPATRYMGAQPQQ